MPRAEQSSAGRIVNFFRTSTLEQATLVLDIVKDVMRDRKQKSSDAKARASAPAAPAPATAATKSKKKAAPKRRKKAPKKPTVVPLPLGDQGAGEAGDAPVS